jgi:hypothetical protein
MTTTESGQWSSVPVTRPGGYETFYVPEVFVQVYSYRNGKPLLLFEGRAYKLLKRAEKPQEYLKLDVRNLIREVSRQKGQNRKSEKRE